MEKLFSRKNMFVALLVLLALCILVCAVLFAYLGGYTYYDLSGHWKICKYTLEGMNPYLLVNTPPALESIGQIPAGFSTVPWACAFGSAFYGGFLPFDGAIIYNLALHFVALIALMLVMKCRILVQGDRKKLLVLLLLPVGHFSYMYSIHYGNAGGIICCLLIIACLLSDEYPVFSGVLLGFAMMKPQIAGIICLTCLLRKQWRVLFSAAAVVIAGWMTTAILTATNPLVLLLQTLETGTASDAQYLGLLNNLKYIGLDSKLILLLNVAIGAVYTLWLFVDTKRRYPNAVNGIFSFAPAAIASTFWLYKNGTDYMITMYASIFFCILVMYKKLSMRDCIGALLSVGYLQMSRCFVYVGAIFFSENIFVRDLFKSVDGLMLAIVGIYLSYLWVKYNTEEILRKHDK